MESEINVSCHAPILSLLLFETVRSVHDQKGLLIGEVCKEIISEKTDDNEMNREQKTTIYLEHCIPVTDSDLFGNLGDINKEKLQKYVDQYCGKVVGWYSFRRNTHVNCRTLSEILTHKSLMQAMHHIKPEYFVAAFMSASIGIGSSTHTFNHIFMRFHPSKAAFEPLKLKIYTMSDKIISVNGYSIRNSFPVSDNFERIINPSQEAANPVMSVLTINAAIAEYFKLISKQLQETEKKRSELEIQINNLRRRLSLGPLEDVKVRELEREPEPAGIQYVRFNSNINYNPNRKENPIKIIPFNKLLVPDKSEEMQSSINQNVQNDTSVSNVLPVFKSLTEKEDTNSDFNENPDSGSNHCSERSMTGSGELNSSVQQCQGGNMDNENLENTEFETKECEKSGKD